MELLDTYSQQSRDLEKFSELRNKAWFDMKERHNTITAAFQSKDNLPEDQAKAIELEIQVFRKEWSQGTGTRYQAMTDTHKQKLEKLIPELEIKKQTVETLPNPVDKAQDNIQSIKRLNLAKRFAR